MVVIVTVSNCQLSQMCVGEAEWRGGGCVQHRWHHCSTAALQQARPGRGSAAWNSIIAQSGHCRTLDTHHAAALQRSLSKSNN